jgi:predicted RNA-binding protein YlqC (UPF0109 family)
VTNESADSPAGGGGDIKGPPLKDLVLFLARALVEHPDQVSVEEIQEPDAVVYELKVAESDLGRVIGRQGRTAKALRTVLSAASAKMRRRAILEILE